MTEREHRVRVVWDAGVLEGRRVHRAYSEDRSDERHLALYEVWMVTVREFFAALAPSDLAAWDAMARDARIRACSDEWYGFERFAAAVSFEEVRDALRAVRRN